ncbi:hypothetical protein [Methylobacterium oryzihabitans]|uniref:Uncharacterized protein n=1 Tax=Methylobacterium oryzihabitans TaxID=2499852 RepID=A0A437NVP3_9HYPH|nr:hypothetical protein [Methylobacterium oryzihabitans]RVU14081.1 hypothetical protein EOE48_24920 [Methylobacterium oryzihabitans]
MRLHALLVTSLALAAVPAMAQNQPTVSRAERTVEGLNRSMETQGQIRSIQQQNQFNTNQIRGDMMRSQSMPSAPPPPIVVAPR